MQQEMSLGQAPAPESARLMLIDTYGLVYRAFFALPYFTTTDGQPTNAVYGFTTMLLKVLEEEAPDFVAVHASTIFSGGTA